MSLVFIGDSPSIKTGMGYIARAIVSELKEKFPAEQIIALSRYFQSPSPTVDVEIPLPAVRSIDEATPFILNQLSSIKDIRAVIVQGDIFYFKFLIAYKNPPPFPVYGYLNFDANDPTSADFAIVSRFNKVAFTCDWALRQFSHPLLNSLEKIVIPHGLRSEFTIKAPHQKYTTLTFIVIANNILRKNLHCILKAFSELNKAGNTNWQLLFITKAKGETDLFQLLIRLNLLSQVFIKEQMTDYELWDVLTKSHYLVLSSLGEGFCLPLIEAIAAGTPMITPDNTAFKDIAKGSIFYNAPGLIQTVTSSWFAVPSVDSLVDKLKRVYHDFYYQAQKLFKSKLKEINEAQSTLISDKEMAGRLIDFFFSGEGKSPFLTPTDFDISFLDDTYYCVYVDTLGIDIINKLYYMLVAAWNEEQKGKKITPIVICSSDNLLQIIAPAVPFSWGSPFPITASNPKIKEFPANAFPLNKIITEDIVYIQFHPILFQPELHQFLKTDVRLPFKKVINYYMPTHQFIPEFGQSFIPEIEFLRDKNKFKVLFLTTMNYHYLLFDTPKTFWIIDKALQTAIPPIPPERIITFL